MSRDPACGGGGFPAHSLAGRAVYVLAGPTAVGKTEVAQAAAERFHLEILSADSMLVYCGMDIGTAKPTPSQRRAAGYRGLDLARPDEEFSVGRWLAAARAACLEAGRRQRIQVATGGAGLYLKALLHGWDDPPPPDDPLREEVMEVYRAAGVEGLRDRLRAEAPERLAALSDPANPRRLMRALELARMGAPLPRGWRATERPSVVGLRMDAGALAVRIRRRVQRMYAEGLLDEVRSLRHRYPAWSETAAAAIGYAEALAVLRGACSREEAMARTEARTRQLAKRQMTWFRGQFDVRWIDVGAGGPGTATVDAVREAWAEMGPTQVRGLQTG